MTLLDHLLEEGVSLLFPGVDGGSANLSVLLGALLHELLLVVAEVSCGEVVAQSRIEDREFCYAVSQACTFLNREERQFGGLGSA